MQTPTHACVGLLCSSVVSSFFTPTLEEKLGLNPLSVAACLFTIFGALLPDIDTPNSPIGRYVPFSSWISRRWPHRTFVHSLLGLLVASILVYGILETGDFLIFQILGIYWPRSHLRFLNVLFATGFFSHLILDTCTRQGIKWFYPLISNAFGYPSVEHYRLTTGDKRAEWSISVFSLGFFIWFLPIALQGADASLSNAIGDYAHLRSYYQSVINREVLLHFEGYLPHNKASVSGSGIILEARSSSFVIFDGKKVTSVGKLALGI